MSDAMDVFDGIENRYRDTSCLSDAVGRQDELRAKSDDWSGEREVKRWRNERDSS